MPQASGAMQIYDALQMSVVISRLTRL